MCVYQSRQERLAPPIAPPGKVNRIPQRVQNLATAYT